MSQTPYGDVLSHLTLKCLPHLGVCRGHNGGALSLWQRGGYCSQAFIHRNLYATGILGLYSQLTQHHSVSPSPLAPMLQLSGLATQHICYLHKVIDFFRYLIVPVNCILPRIQGSLSSHHTLSFGPNFTEFGRYFIWFMV